MASKFMELPGLRAELERVEFQPSSDTPAHRPHQFAYYIVIINDSHIPVAITGRRWVLTNASGHLLIIEGDGVIGRFPRLLPGGRFHYHSYHLIDTDTTAQGAYYAQDDDGNRVIARLAQFQMKVPPH